MLSYFNPISPPSRRYNCIAWAANETHRLWWPDPNVYWPPGISLDGSLESFIQAFKSKGYEPCDSSDYEVGFQKIALYVGDNDRPTHAARQVPSGFWTSKLGQNLDIEHELSALEGGMYGRVSQILKCPE